MAKKYGKVDIAKEFGTGLQTATESLLKPTKEEKLFIGVPNESHNNERRVALTPASVATLVGMGHRVSIETKAGEKSNYSDHEYSEHGAEIAPSKEAVYEAQLILKAAPPSIDDIDLMHNGQILISPLHLPSVTKEYLQKLLKKKVIAMAMEYIKDDAGSFPLVRMLSEIAGTNAIHIAAELLSNVHGGRGVLLGGISGVPPAKVVILGAGMVAEHATRAALGMGADVRIIDDNIYKLIRIQEKIGHPLHTSVINPIHLQRQLTSADVVIGAIHSKTGRTPMIVSEELISQMKSGSVIVDISIDQGGCFETSKMTTHEKPTFIKHGVIHYCVPNIASRVSRTASLAISNILSTILIKTGSLNNINDSLLTNPGLRHGVYTFKGSLVSSYLGQRFEIKYTNLDLLLTSSI